MKRCLKITVVTDASHEKFTEELRDIINMEVSINGGTPKPFILIGFPFDNPCILGTRMTMVTMENPHMNTSEPLIERAWQDSTRRVEW